MAINAPAHLELTWTLSCTALVFLMQAGFCLLEGGMVRTKNSINVAVKNLLDCAISILVFSLFGFSLMFGIDVAGFIGMPGSVDLLQDSNITAFFLFQVVFCSTATTIISGAVAERTRLVTFAITVLLVSGLIYPILGHWVWGGSLTGTGAGWLASLGFVDFAGATVVHAVGGFCALAAVLVIGPRRYIPSNKTVGGHSLTLAVLGCFLLWFGWWGFNGGSCLAVGANVPFVLFNTQIAAAAGGVTATIICLAGKKRIEVIPLISGVLAGLVAVTAGCDAMPPILAAVTGSVGAALALWADEMMRRRRIDDVVSAFPVHGVAGVWGTIAVALFIPSELLTTSRFEFLVVQLIGTTCVCAVAFMTVFATLKVASQFFELRVSAEEEKTGLNMAEHGATNEVQDLVTEMYSHREQGDFSKAVNVESHTEAGQIATAYNEVIDRVQEEISGREEANEWLSSERLRLESVLQHAGVGIYQLSNDFEFTAINPTLLETLGYKSASELLSQGPISVTPWLDGTENQAIYSESLKQGVAVNDLETRITNRDGKEIWLLESLAPVRNDNGELVTWLGTVHDITDRKQALIAEIEIERAKSRAKGEFLANMSHEIRTPLNGVIGMLDLLAGSQMSEQNTHYVDIARGSAESLLAVINDILDFSKIEAGRMDVELIKFDLRDVVESTSEQFAIRAHMEGLELNCDVAPQIPVCVEGDPERIRQVLINLLGNAVKFTRSGEINIRVGRCGEFTTFAVEDTGIGMSSDQCDRMFEAFTQADASTTREFGGTGLGLSISYQLVELMGGQLKVESTEGKGSTFFFALPLPILEEQESNNERMTDLVQSLPNTRVLVVDDNSTNCEILKSQLTAWGFLAEVCQCSELAADRLLLAKRNGQPFDILLLDFCMPVMDGSDVARLVRSSSELSDLPILLLSSNHEIMPEDERNACGIDIAMTKPVRQSRLFDSILTVLQGKAKAAPPEPSPLQQLEMLQSENPTRPIADDISLANSRSVGPENETPMSPDIAPVASSPVLQDLDELPVELVGTQSETKASSSPIDCDVLVVEDNQVNQIVVRQLLGSKEYGSEIAENGEIAISMLEQRRYGLILMDGHMPVMDGLKATSRIRRLQRDKALPLNPSVPIIALTANASSKSRDAFRQAGVDDFLSKPVTLAKLESALNSFLPKEQTTHGQPASDPKPSTPKHSALATDVSSSVEELSRPKNLWEQSPSAATSQSPSRKNSVAVSGFEFESKELFDSDMFESRCGTDPDFKMQILELMRTSMGNTLQEIDSAKATGDFEQVERVSHRLKGAAGDSALVAVSDAAAKLEIAAEQRQPDTVEQSFVSLKGQVDQTLDHLETVLLQLTEAHTQQA